AIHRDSASPREVVFVGIEDVGSLHEGDEIGAAAVRERQILLLVPDADGVDPGKIMQGDPGGGDEDVRLGGGVELLEVRGTGKIGFEGKIHLLPEGAVGAKAKAAQVSAIEQGGVQAILHVGRYTVPTTVEIKSATDVDPKILVGRFSDEAIGPGEA